MKKRRTNPPGLFLGFFRWFCHEDLENYIEGDLMELYEERLRSSGKRKADLKFVIDVLLLFRPEIIRPSQGIGLNHNYDMFRNYFKTGIRNILRYKVFSIINIFGLATALSVCMLIIMMLADQARYDQFNVKRGRIYRILTDTKTSRMPYSTSPFPLAEALKSGYPSIEATVNLRPGVGGDVTYNGKSIEMGGYFTSQSFFKIFSFNLIEGNKNSALLEPRSVILSEKTARKLFGSEDPLGKTVAFSDRQLSYPLDYDQVGAPPVSWGSFTVTGVIDESKYKSHIRFDLLLSSSTLPALYADSLLNDESNDWKNYFRTYTYVLMFPGKDQSDLSGALNELTTRKYADIHSDQVKGLKLLSQNLNDIQMHPYGNDTNNRLQAIGYYFLYILAAIILFSACLNYVNLSVARTLTRLKEIGVRKVTGAGRKSLIIQFLSESVIISLLALSLGIGMLSLLREGFLHMWLNQFLRFELPDTLTVYMIFVAFAIVIGVVAGLYPSIYMSGFKPIKGLKNHDSFKSGMPGMRKVLSTSQFVVSLFFVITSILILEQFRHYSHFEYGFNAKNIVNIQLQGHDAGMVKNILKSVPGIEDISACDLLPAGGISNGTSVRETGSSHDFTSYRLIRADGNFTGNLGIRLLAGRNLPDSGVPGSKYVLVNEAAVKESGYQYPWEMVGRLLESKWGDQYEVLGVVSDFQYDLPINRDKLNPVIIWYDPQFFRYVNIKIAQGSIATVMKEINKKWKEIDPSHAIRYRFYTDQLATEGKGIFDLASILSFIAFLATVIACIGLLGMAIFSVERRTKEVAIRKVLGAMDYGIAALLSKEFIKILAVSVCIGTPISYFINNFWLEMLPNHVNFNIGIILLGTSILLIPGLFAIGSQTFRASRQNPVESLKME